MHPDACQRFATQWPAIKAEWRRLLAKEPVLTPLGRPETLVHLMNATLMQVQKGLRTEPNHAWLHACRPMLGSVHRHCACGLNPLLTYFATGELALRAAAGPLVPGEINEILDRFRAVAGHEVSALCSLCRNPGGEACELRSSGAPRRN